jgi:hypothetical protein
MIFNHNIEDLEDLEDLENLNMQDEIKHLFLTKYNIDLSLLKEKDKSILNKKIQKILKNSKRYDRGKRV